MADDEPGYEQARDELAQVVAKLEAGGLSLEDSLALWERGEALARVCERHLAGARAKVDAVLREAESPDDDVRQDGFPMSSPPEEAWERAIADAHDGYHDETRLHRDPDVLVEDVVSWRMLSPHLMRALAFLVAPTVLLVIWLLLGYLASTSGPSITGRLVMNVLLAVLVVLYLAGVAAFFAPAKEPIAEYSRLLENRAGAARGAYDWVTRAARARRTPAEVAPSTVAGVPVLLFRQRSERAMLLVQPYGRDLYVGWTMWRSRSTATLLAHFLRDTFGRFAPLPVFSAELRAASTRAMRESVHSLAREGVAAAAYADVEGSRRRVEQPAPPAAAPAVTADEDAPAAAEPTRRREGLPRSAPAADPTAGWEQEWREHVTRDDAGWGPPPR